MPYRHKLQASRFELKYIISEACARSVRDFLRSHLELDEHARPDQENAAYPVFSLYLDTLRLTLFGQTVQGAKNRFKLRIRFYDGDPSGPVFLEIKRRVTDVIRKERAAISREGVRRLLSGSRVHESYLAGSNGNFKTGAALQRFCNLCETIGARPSCYVSYLREAYVVPDSDQLRVTFDRRLLGSPYEPDTDLLPPSQGARPNMGGVILELKFTDRFPDWMREMAQAFDLHRRSVPKYIECIKAMGIQPGRVSGPGLGAMP